MSRILFVSYEIHPTTMGGCGVLIHHAANVLLAAGHDVVLLLDVPESYFRSFVDKDRLQFSVPDRVRAYRVDDLCDDFPLNASDVPCVFQWKSLRFAHAQRRVLELERIDFVEYFEYCGAGYYAFAERLYSGNEAGNGPVHRIPVLGSRAHGSIEVLDRYGAGQVADSDKFMLHSLERGAMDLSEVVLFPSKAYYERYYRDMYSLPAERVVISSPPKLPFPRVTRRPKKGERSSIVFLGRMFHLKGVDQFVHTAVMLLKQRPELDCTIELIGYDSDESPVHGSYAAYLKTLIPSRLRDRFVFTGQLTHEQIAARLGNALFAVFPNRTESFCYALHEIYDAGVPVVVNNLPAFTDFFHDGRNAIVYDGTTVGLLAAMKRMIDDPALRERLCRPFAVAEEPISDFYERPRAHAALVPAPGSDPTPAGVPSPLVVVLCRDGIVQSSPAIQAMQNTQAKVVALVPSSPDGEETLWWLGRPWHVRGPSGEPIEPSDITTTDALAVLDGADVPDSQWLATCIGALSRRASMAFAGTWCSVNGKVIPGIVDVAPELQPFERGAELCRVLVRTEPGVPLADVFCTSLGALGHLGYLWHAIGKWGRGVLLPKVLIAAADTAKRVEAKQLKSLLLRYGGVFPERLALLTGLMYDRAVSHPAGPMPRMEPTVESKIRVANELGGKTLARLAMKKIAKRIRGGER